MVLMFVAIVLVWEAVFSFAMAALGVPAGFFAAVLATGLLLGVPLGLAAVMTALRMARYESRRFPPEGTLQPSEPVG